MNQKITFPRKRWDHILDMKRRRGTAANPGWKYFFVKKITKAQISPDFDLDFEACSWFYENWEEILKRHKVDEALEKAIWG